MVKVDIASEALLPTGSDQFCLSFPLAGSGVRLHQPEAPSPVVMRFETVPFDAGKDISMQFGDEPLLTLPQLHLALVQEVLAHRNEMLLVPGILFEGAFDAPDDLFCLIVRPNDREIVIAAVPYNNPTPSGEVSRARIKVLRAFSFQGIVSSAQFDASF